MKKMPLAQVLTKFYSRDAMYHVGQNWKGNGLLLLLGICFYISIFSGYSWSKYIEAKYEEFYQPVLPLMPNATYEKGHFTFDVDMPHTIYHPLTQKPAVFIDTSKTIKDDEIKNALSEYPCTISNEGVFITNFELPLMPEHYEFYEIFVKPFENGRESGFMTFLKQMTSMFSDSGDSKTYTGEEIKSYLDVSIKQTVYFTVIIMSIGTFIQEALKNLDDLWDNHADYAKYEKIQKLQPAYAPLRAFLPSRAFNSRSLQVFHGTTRNICGDHPIYHPHSFVYESGFR